MPAESARMLEIRRFFGGVVETFLGRVSAGTDVLLCCEERKGCGREARIPALREYEIGLRA